MWYIDASNGGCYSYIKNEYPAPEEMNFILNLLTLLGVEFRVNLWESEYFFYHSEVELINDETLETIYVHHQIGRSLYHQSEWWIEVEEENYRTFTIWSSINGFYLKGIVENFLKATMLSSLPLLPEVTTSHHQTLAEFCRKYGDKYDFTDDRLLPKKSNTSHTEVEEFDWEAFASDEVIL